LARSIAVQGKEVPLDFGVDPCVLTLVDKSTAFLLVLAKLLISVGIIVMLDLLGKDAVDQLLPGDSELTVVFLLDEVDVEVHLFALELRLELFKVEVVEVLHHFLHRVVIIH
jgi:hypothetical protein